jgi:hypothetical protein
MNLRGAKVTGVWIDEFAFEPTSKRIATFTKESKIFHQTHYYANPIMYSFAEMEEMAYWCHDTFGPRGFNQEKMHTAWDFQNDPDYIFWFSDEKNLMLFILRWS